MSLCSRSFFGSVDLVPSPARLSPPFLISCCGAQKRSALSDAEKAAGSVQLPTTKKAGQFIVPKAAFCVLFYEKDTSSALCVRRDNAQTAYI